VHLKRGDSYAILATDASYNNNVSHIGFVCKTFNVGRNGINNNNNNNNTHNDNDHDSHVDENKFIKFRSLALQGESRIVYEELRAVAMALQRLRDEQVMPDFVILAIDSMHAKGLISKGMANTTEAINLLREIDDHLGLSRLFMYYIPSADNPADALSRPGEEWNEPFWVNCLQQSVKYLDVARGVFLSGGKQRYSERRKREVEEEREVFAK